MGEGSLDKAGLFKDESLDKDLFVVKLPQGDILLKNPVIHGKPNCEISSPILDFTPSDETIANVTNSRAGRPWSKKPTIFQNGPRFTFGLALKLLGLLPVMLWSWAGNLESMYESLLNDRIWEMVNERFNLPKGFLERHSDLDLIDRCDERLLPRWPVSPGPLARNANSLLVRPEIEPSVLNPDSELARIYNRVKCFGVPNYRGARVRINPNFKTEIWLDLLQGYDDLKVIDYMLYGWPAGYEAEIVPTLGLPNHSSSLKQPEAVDKYLIKEKECCAILGPFTKSPFSWFRSNPLMVRPKKEVGKYRVILDLSFPLNESVNSHIPSLSYDGAPYKLRLPTALNLAELIAKEGKGCFMYKLDLARAYRQLPIDPLDWPLLGISWKDEMYIDLCVPFGLRHGAMFCERVTTAICYAVKRACKAAMEAYIDDMGGVGGTNKELVEIEYKNVCATIVKMGLNLALDKCEGPSTFMTWTGTSFDSVKMIMKIEESKVSEALEIAENLLKRVDITLEELESFVGKIQHCIKFCPGGKRFLNRILQMRREMDESSRYGLTQGAVEDIDWLRKFLQVFNGQAVIRSQLIPSVKIHVDACLTGGGGIWNEKAYFSVGWPDFIKLWDISINDLEMFNVLLAVRLWKEELKGKTCRIYCDNNTAVQSMSSGRAKNTFMAGCLRELWWLCCTQDIFLACDHVAGVQNEIADLLSRANNSDSDERKFQNFIQASPLKEEIVYDESLFFPDRI